MNNRSDIVILGAGAAGCACAIAARRQGFTVTLIEQTEFPRSRPGESLHPGMESILAKLGVSLAAQNWERHAGQHVRWGERDEFVAFGGTPDAPWLGFQAERTKLDALLLQHAKLLGARIVQPCRAHRPLMEAGRVVGVLTSEGELRCRWLVDAAGGRHWLAKHLGTDIVRCSPRLLVEYGYCAGQSAPCDRFPLLFGNADGWLWLSRVKPGLYHWCRLCLKEGERGREGEGENAAPPPPQTWGGGGADNAIENRKSKIENSPSPPLEFGHLAPVGSPRKSDVTWRIAPATAGAGYFLAGDAAFVVDPLASHGVLKAVLSGMQIAHLLARCAAGQETETGIAWQYHRWLLSLFQQDVAHLTTLYRQLDPDF